MISFLRKFLNQGYLWIEKNPWRQQIFYPIWEAFDSFLFRKGEVTKDSPYIRDQIDLKRYMITVVIALLPATLAAIYLFGIKVLAIIITSYVFGGLVEIIFAIVKKEKINEGFLVTGLLFALILPPTTPWWMVAIGIIAGVFFGKEIFGGTGKNIFNPALVGRIFLAITFPQAMTTQWLEPFTHALTSATPLMNFKLHQQLTPLSQLFLGTTTGSAGETSSLLLLLGGLFLMYTKVSNWRIPIAYLGTLIFLSVIFSWIFPTLVAPPLFQLFSGGLLLGAFFMATDPVTSPFTNLGKWIFGSGCGILTLLIRSLSGYTEGVMFAIVFMNIFTPLIDHLAITFQYAKKQ